MKLLIFTEGTILMHKNAFGHTREEIVQQVKVGEQSVHEYESYVPIGGAVEKLKNWQAQGLEIVYLTSRKSETEINNIQSVLDKYNFPKCNLEYRRENEQYNDVAERILPDILIEDDCESIVGVPEMTITHVKQDIKDKIKSVPILEFGGIDHLASDFLDL